MRVDFLYIEDCEGSEAARRALESALQCRGFDAGAIESTLVEESTATQLRFTGSPTIRINDRDIEPGFVDRGGYGLQCRIYPTASGHGHVPDTGWIEAAVDEAQRIERMKVVSNEAGDDEPIIRLRQEDPVHAFILQTFATTGASPSLDDIRDRFELHTSDEAEERVRILEEAGAVHRNAGDAAITHAYPFSNDPTPHRVHLAGGPSVFAMCAIDALGIPFMVRRDATIESVCAECESAVRIEIQAAGIGEFAPAETVVWLAARVEGCVVATDLCPSLNFFCSPEHLSAWKQRARANGEQLTLPEALARGRQIFERLMEDAER